MKTTINMNYKCNGVYVCSLIDEDFIPGNFFSKNSKLKLVNNVLNIKGYDHNSLINMKKSFFFLSFYEENKQISGASFGYSWMNPFDISDSFIGSPNDNSKRMINDCKQFSLVDDRASFTYFFINEIFEVKCYLENPKYNSEIYEPHIIADIKNVDRSIESIGMRFRFITRLDKDDINHRNYK